MQEASSKTSAAHRRAHSRKSGIFIFDFLGGQSGWQIDSIHAPQKAETQ